MLLLLLGLAINGEFKESFVEKIQHNLDTQVQIQLIPFIQLVTEELSFSISKTVLLEMNCPGAKPSKKSSISAGLLGAELSPADSMTNSTVSTQSSTTLFAHACQQLSTQQRIQLNAGHTNQLCLSYQNIEQFSYFLNNKLMPNMQRIVDERDSYLESIIELEQDKVCD